MIQPGKTIEIENTKKPPITKDDFLISEKEDEDSGD